MSADYPPGTSPEDIARIRAYGGRAPANDPVRMLALCDALEQARAECAMLTDERNEARRSLRQTDVALLQYPLLCADHDAMTIPRKARWWVDAYQATLARCTTLEQARAERDELAEKLAEAVEQRDTYARERTGEVWFWTGDATEDDVASLACPVFMSAQQARDITKHIAELEATLAAEQGKPEGALPGWRATWPGYVHEATLNKPLATVIIGCHEPSVWDVPALERNGRVETARGAMRAAEAAMERHGLGPEDTVNDIDMPRELS